MVNLLIVESPGKIKKLRKILGAGWDVKASVGHSNILFEIYHDIICNGKPGRPPKRLTKGVRVCIKNKGSKKCEAVHVKIINRLFLSILIQLMSPKIRNPCQSSRGL